MKKFFYSALSIFIMICMLTGCASADNNEQNNAEGQNIPDVGNMQGGAAQPGPAGSSSADLETLEAELKAQTEKLSISSETKKTDAYTDCGEDAIKISGTASEWNIESAGADIHEGIVTENNTLTIKREGTYILSGNITGNVVINVSEKEKVRLVLNGITLRSGSGAAICAESADKLIISTALGSKNLIYDADGATAAIYAECDLTLNGSGELGIEAGSKHGIYSKDDLKVTDGNYVINSAGAGLKGKDSVSVFGGTFDINSEGDAVKSDWGEDEKTPEEIAKAQKGNVYIAGGSFKIISGDDAVSASGTVRFSDGNLSAAAKKKGIKAANGILIDDGVIDITECYEGLESECIIIDGGTISICSSDDGINAAEAENTANRADITDSADTTNAANTTNADNVKGRFNKGFMDGFGRGFAEGNGNARLFINGGNIYINALGDGIDVNGAILQTGGYAVVDGPSDSGNGALDYDSGYIMNGGTVIALGSSGMFQTISETSANYAVSVFGNFTAGSKVTFSDGNGTVMYDISSKRAFGSVVIASDELKNGENYSVSVNGEKQGDLTISERITVVGEAVGGMNGFGGRHGMGGFGGGERPENGGFGGGERPEGGGFGGNTERPGKGGFSGGEDQQPGNEGFSGFNDNSGQPSGQIG